MTAKKGLPVALAAILSCLLPSAGVAAPAAPVSPVPPPAPETAPAPAPAQGSLTLVVQHAHGNPPFALVGERVAIRGVVVPYVAGQKVNVTVFRKGRGVFSKQLSIIDLGNGAGQFHLGYSSPHTGTVTVRAEHAATPLQAGFAARPVSVQYERARIGFGARGRVVRLLQSELARLHYEVPVNGDYGSATGRAMIAYRKMTGLQRVETADARVFDMLQRGAGRYHVRYPKDGNHVEADLTRQVLVEVERHGRVRRIYTMSSGKPSTPTVLGRFRVYNKEPGTNSEGMVDSSYFIRGYAIHGYAEVPVYAASHGCLRIPIPNAPAVYAWVKSGYPVDVYTDSGRGSRTVRSDAGP
jgi:hypothetical protein